MLLKNLFGSVDLPADFAEKVETIFEATVVEKVDAQIAAQILTLQESFDAKLVTEKEAFIAESMATVDKVIEDTILEWAKENAVGLDTEVKGQLAESFLVGLKSLFEKADIELTGEGVAAKEIAALNESLATAKADAEAAKLALVESTVKLVDIKRAEIIAEATAGLADTVAHRAKRLCEAFEFKSEDDFRSKATMIVEAVTGKKIDEASTIKGTVNADGTIVAVVDGGAKAPIDQANTASGQSPAPEIVTDVQKRAELDQHVGAKDLKEQFEASKALHAPHFGEDLVALTLASMKK